MIYKRCLRCAEVYAPGGRCPNGHGSRSGRKPAGYGYGWQLRRKARLEAGEQCAYRYRGGCDGPLQLDHIRPLSLGGLAVEDNEQILCRKHNIAKGGRNRFARSA